MRFYKHGWFKALVAVFSVTAGVAALGLLLGMAYHKNERGPNYVDELRDDYFPEYYVVHGKWPADLSGVRQYIEEDNIQGRGSSVWMEGQELPNITVIKNTKQEFAGKLESPAFPGSQDVLAVKAPSDKKLESEFVAGLENDYLLAFYSNHRNWPADLAGAKKYYSSRHSLQFEAMAKLCDELQPKLIVTNTSDQKFSGVVEFRHQPSESVDVSVYSPVE